MLSILIKTELNFWTIQKNQNWDISGVKFS